MPFLVKYHCYLNFTISQSIARKQKVKETWKRQKCVYVWSTWRTRLQRQKRCIVSAIVLTRQLCFILADKRMWTKVNWEFNAKVSGWMYYFLTSHQQLSLSKSFCSPGWAGNFGVNSTRYLNLEGDSRSWSVGHPFFIAVPMPWSSPGWRKIYDREVLNQAEAAFPWQGEGRNRMYEMEQRKSFRQFSVTKYVGQGSGKNKPIFWPGIL